MIKSLKVISLVSGGWTTMELLVKCSKKWKIWPVEIVWVIASKSWIWAIEKATAHNIFTVILNKENKTNPDILNWLIDTLNADVIIWNWWLPLVPKKVIEHINIRKWFILNQHPWPLRANHLDFGWKWMIWITATAARVIYLLEIWASWDELFTESTVHIMTENFDEWYSVWVKKLDIQKEIEDYREKIKKLNKEEKEKLLKKLIEDIQQKLLTLEHKNVAEVIKYIAENRKIKKHPSYDEILVPEENKEILQKAKKKAIELF